MKKLLAVSPLLAVILSGCATLNKNECLTADWYQIGYEDGALGYADTRIASHREACAQYEVTPVFRDYQDGYEEGLIRYCTARSGFKQGKNGYSYSGVCPSGLEPSFLDGYEAGKQIYTVTQLIHSLNSEQRRNENNIERLQKQIVDQTNLMLADNTSIADRYALNAEMSQMQRDLGALEERNRQIIVETAEAEAKLKLLNQKYVYY